MSSFSPCVNDNDNSSAIIAASGLEDSGYAPDSIASKETTNIPLLYSYAGFVTLDHLCHILGRSVHRTMEKAGVIQLLRNG